MIRNSTSFMSMRTYLIFSFAILTVFGCQNAEARPPRAAAKAEEAKKANEAPKPVTDRSRIKQLLPDRHAIEHMEQFTGPGIPPGAQAAYRVYSKNADHARIDGPMRTVTFEKYVDAQGKVIKVETEVLNRTWLETECKKTFFYVDEAGNMRQFTPTPPSGPVSGTQSGALATSPKFAANRPTDLLISGVAGPSDDFNAAADRKDKTYWAIDIDEDLAAFDAQRTQPGGVRAYLPFINCAKATVPSIPAAKAAYCWLTDDTNPAPILEFAVVIEAARTAGNVSVTMVNLWTTLDILLGKIRGAASTEYRQAYGEEPVSFDLTCDELQTKISWLSGVGKVAGCN